MAEHASSFLMLTLAGIGTVLLIFMMKYLVAIRQAAMSLGNQQSYQDLADRAVRLQEETAEELKALRAEMSAIRERAAEIEKILKSVE